MKNLLKILLLLSFNLLMAQKEYSSVFEGFYFRGDEVSRFDEIDFQNCCINSSNWADFTNDVYNNENFTKLDVENGLNGIYMKVICTQKFGESFGHLGAWNSEVMIIEILEVDPKRTFAEFVKQNKVRKRQKS
ncbi:MAG: hypothetical protein ABIQ27_00225 [Flavobacterium sp.]|uniref:hypothetical protein n=1 Tax=Flavobacterium sp. TaxID=239 RepID=UPI003267E5B7